MVSQEGKQAILAIFFCYVFPAFITWFGAWLYDRKQSKKEDKLLPSDFTLTIMLPFFNWLGAIGMIIYFIKKAIERRISKNKMVNVKSFEEITQFKISRDIVDSVDGLLVLLRLKGWKIDLNVLEETRVGNTFKTENAINLILNDDTQKFKIKFYISGEKDNIGLITVESYTKDLKLEISDPIKMIKMFSSIV